MDVKRNALLLFYSFIVKKICSSENVQWLNSIQQNLEQLGMQESLIVANNLSTLSRTYSTTVKYMANKFPSFIVDLNAMSEPQIVANAEYWQDLPNKKSTLNIVYIEGLTSENAMNTVVKYLFSLLALENEDTWGYFLIFVILKSRIENARETFELLFEKYFLYVTIVEIFEEANTSTMLNSKFTLYDNIRIFEYNPFNKTLRVEPFLKNSILFTRKLDNVNGYPLKVFGFECDDSLNVVDLNMSPYNSMSEILDSFTCGIMVTQVNFTVNMMYMNEMSFEKKITFEYSSISGTYSSYYSCAVLHYETGPLVLIILQQSIVRKVTPWNLIGVIILIAVIVSITLLFLSSKSFTMTIYDITFIILGMSSGPEQRTTKEKLVYLFLTLVSIILSQNCLQYLYEITTNKKEFLELSSVDDILDSNINVIISSSTHNLLLLMADVNPSYKFFDLLERATVVHISYDDCWRLVLFGKYILCATLFEDADHLVNRIMVHLNDDWSVSTFPSRITDLIGYHLARNSPYVDRFFEIESSIMECGLRKLKLHLQSHLFTILYLTNNFNSSGSENMTEIAETNEEVKLSLILTFLIVIGYLTSTVCLIVEVINFKWIKKENL